MFTKHTNTMKSILFFLLLVCVSKPVFSQPRILDLNQDYFPNAVDSNYFSVLLGSSFFFDYGRKEDISKKGITPNIGIQGNRPFDTEMEFNYFFGHILGVDYDARFQPNAHVRIHAFLNYMSSTYGLGISDKKLLSSVGFFYGSYYRKVPEDGNFVTRRRKIFENYPLQGFYLQSSSSHASVFLSIAKERKRFYEYVRLTYKPAGKFVYFRKSGLLQNLQVVYTKEDFSGNGFGLSLGCVKNTNIELKWTIPDNLEKAEQLRVGYKMTSGAILKVEYWVN